MRTVRRFINHLNAATGINRPIDDMLISSHANSSGQMQIQMWNGQRGLTDYDTVVDTMDTAHPNQSIEIPDALIGHNAGDAITHQFQIKGCNVGKARLFLVKLKEALGDHVLVSAPLHFHGLTFNSSLGVFEWMAYEFLLTRPTAFANRAAAVAAFRAANLELFDGTGVPQAFWDSKQAPLVPADAPAFAWQRDWIPSRIGAGVSHTIRAPITPALGATRTVRVRQQFRVDRETFSWSVTYPNATAVPADAATRRTEVRNSISSDSSFGPLHDFPTYERWGYADFNDFFTGFTWNINRKGRRLMATGTRHAYTVLVPIVDTTTGNLVHNFYPNAGSPHAERNTGLQTNDPQFFEQV